MSEPQSATPPPGPPPLSRLPQGAEGTNRGQQPGVAEAFHAAAPHVSIAPVDEHGKVDVMSQEELRKKQEELKELTSGV